jgi:hypothetical protein
LLEITQLAEPMLDLWAETIGETTERCVCGGLSCVGLSVPREELRLPSFNVIAKRRALDRECNVDLRQESASWLYDVAELLVQGSGVPLSDYRQTG